MAKMPLWADAIELLASDATFAAESGNILDRRIGLTLRKVRSSEAALRREGNKAFDGP